ncbi:MAG: 1-deoxy-D-xylulose-5-phosphate reductoisomerase [Bacteroidales bacterium]|nr:1-deoxy-D-xylulose-5-phosphate reductoisomerase [Bacteroidales bacterium]MDD3892218.1 1-deoxy-D-xylulose-5-phosphate reductoisomerase [Bacteroidales bacterium]
MKRRIAILGSTGSIGTQALQVIESHPNLFEVEVLTANNNADLLIQQAIKHKPNTVVIGNKELYTQVLDALDHYDIKVYAGDEAISQVVEMETIDMVLTAMVGYSGLKPTINAIKAKKPIALANKETLVVAGELIMSLAYENNVPILPVDSEHSAIFQCLVGENNAIEKIILTASGGPFLNYSSKELDRVTKADALNHPNWCMGNKVTIDSATLMNKGFEVIEAKWLFNLKPEQIEVIVHPQSIIHSLVQFEDGSIKAQMGLPDMKLPIQYALSFPNRIKSDFERFSFASYPNFSFEEPDTKIFPALDFAREAMVKGGNMPCILNAANEIAVEAFLNDKISFLKMSKIVEDCLLNVSFIAKPNYHDYFETDSVTREYAKRLII